MDLSQLINGKILSLADLVTVDDLAVDQPLALCLPQKCYDFQTRVAKVIFPSSKTPGVWQSTELSSHGFGRSQEFSSRHDAAAQAIEMGYCVFDTCFPELVFH